MRNFFDAKHGATKINNGFYFGKCHYRGFCFLHFLVDSCCNIISGQSSFEGGEIPEEAEQPKLRDKKEDRLVGSSHSHPSRKREILRKVIKVGEICNSWSQGNILSSCSSHHGLSCPPLKGVQSCVALCSVVLDFMSQL